MLATASEHYPIRIVHLTLSEEEAWVLRTILHKVEARPGSTPSSAETIRDALDGIGFTADTHEFQDALRHVWGRLRVETED